jgi:hypothetical protein
MVVIRDDARIARLKKVSQYLSLIGMFALIAGMILAFVGDLQSVFFWQLLALLVGWLFSQVGIYLAHRYTRRPRPDEVLDEAFRKVARNGRMYHYILPAPHILLLPTGIIVINAKYQTGKISVEGEKWKQKGLGLRRFFGQENLGNPTKEVDAMVQNVINFIHKEVPEAEEIPIAPMIVFTTKGLDTLDLDKSDIPAMHYTKVKGFMRQQRQQGAEKPMDESVYQAIRAALDKKAGNILGEKVVPANETGK